MFLTKRLRRLWISKKSPDGRKAVSKTALARHSRPPVLAEMGSYRDPMGATDAEER